jgi:cytoskeletal protein RodZ
MSLINDALRRANQEKKNRPPDPSGGAPMHPVNPPPQSRTSFFGPILIVLIAMILLGAGWFFWKGSQANSKQNEVVKVETPDSAKKPATPVTEVATPEAASIEREENAVVAPPVDEIPAAEPSIEPPSNPIETETPSAPATVETPPAPTPPTLRLQGVFYRLSKPTALINGRTFAVGEKISGAEVVKIERQSVTLEWNGQTIILELTQ